MNSRLSRCWRSRLRNEYHARGSASFMAAALLDDKRPAGAVFSASWNLTEVVCAAGVAATLLLSWYGAGAAAGVSGTPGVLCLVFRAGVNPPRPRPSTDGSLASLIVPGVAGISGGSCLFADVGVVAPNPLNPPPILRPAPFATLPTDDGLEAAAAAVEGVSTSERRREARSASPSEAVEAGIRGGLPLPMAP